MQDQNVCIWMEQGQTNLKRFSIERTEHSDFWTLPELLNLTLTLIQYCKKFAEAGLYHNDIKPDNVILLKEEGTNYRYQYKFIDLGGACLKEKSAEDYGANFTILYFDDKAFNHRGNFCDGNPFSEEECV